MKTFAFIPAESVLVVFIDYGNSETKPANEIYAMQESLTRLPAMAVACTLADVRFDTLRFNRPVPSLLPVISQQSEFLG